MSREVVLAPVSRMSTTDAVVGQLQEMIVRGDYRVGDPLPAERELASQLDVSRNVVREALGILGQKGLVRVEHGRGAFVTVPTADHVRDSLQLLLSLRKVGLIELCDARMLIEPELARLAARNRTPESSQALSALLARLDALGDKPEEHVEADFAFHREIARLAQQSVLGAMVEAIRMPLQLSMNVGLSVEDSIRHSDAQHRLIHDAIVRGDELGAEQAARAHLQYVRTYLQEAEQ